MRKYFCHECQTYHWGFCPAEWPLDFLLHPSRRGFGTFFKEMVLKRLLIACLMVLGFSAPAFASWTVSTQDWVSNSPTGSGSVPQVGDHFSSAADLCNAEDSHIKYILDNGSSTKSDGPWSVVMDPTSFGYTIITPSQVYCTWQATPTTGPQIHGYAQWYTQGTNP